MNKINQSLLKHFFWSELDGINITLKSCYGDATQFLAKSGKSL